MSAPRIGEVRLPFDPADRVSAGVSFIGVIRSPWSPGDCPRNIGQARETGRGAQIDLDPDYAAGLRGLKTGQQIIVLYWMDRGQRDLIVQNPPHTDAPRGTFALRSPVRPNPISLAVVRITSLDGATIGIDAIDAFDGTPVLDIKPWLPGVDVPPGWRP